MGFQETMHYDKPNITTYQYQVFIHCLHERVFGGKLSSLTPYKSVLKLVISFSRSV